MRRGYGIRVFPVLCVLLLLLPAVCAGGTFDCDACGKSVKPKARRLNNETINGDEGYWEEYVCPNCGAHHDRDVNAALNIKNEGYRILTEAQQS